MGGPDQLSFPANRRTAIRSMNAQSFVVRGTVGPTLTDGSAHRAHLHPILKFRPLPHETSSPARRLSPMSATPCITVPANPEPCGHLPVEEPKKLTHSHSGARLSAVFSAHLCGSLAFGLHDMVVMCGRLVVRNYDSLRRYPPGSDTGVGDKSLPQLGATEIFGIWGRDRRPEPTSRRQHPARACTQFSAHDLVI